MRFRPVRLLLWPLMIASTAAALYLSTAFGLPFLTRAAPTSGPVEAYLVTNGLHADFAFPATTPEMDWTQTFPLEDFQAPPHAPELITIGWGDREFYLNTPVWSDLTIARALSALFGTNRSLLHVAYVRPSQLPETTYRLWLSRAQYRALVQYILGTLATENDRAIHLAGSGYGRTDTFYAAQGNYHLINTCNTWVGRGLHAVDFPVSPWTPFAANLTQGLMQQPLISQ